MNSAPVILHNLSGTRSFGDLRVPKGTRATSIIPVSDDVLSNCTLLDRADHELIEAAIDAKRNNPFTRIREALDLEMLDGDCPNLSDFLALLDESGMAHVFDLKFWLRAWRAA